MSRDLAPRSFSDLPNAILNQQHRSAKKTGVKTIADIMASQGDSFLNSSTDPEAIDFWVSVPENQIQDNLAPLALD